MSLCLCVCVCVCVCVSVSVCVCLSVCVCDSRRIVLNNPEKRNTLSLAMLESLREDLLTDSDDLRVIIISGKHSRSSGERCVRARRPR